MTDEQRADSMGYTGTPWAHTPHLDRLAAQGTRFLAAYTPSPVCVPARACLLTAKAASSIGVLNNHHTLAQPTPHFLTWAMAAQGYQVASVGKQHYACQRRAFDWEGGQVLGDRVGYTSYSVPVDPDEAGVVRYKGGKTPWLLAGRFPGGVDDTPEMHNVQAALDWLRRRDPERPYLLRLSLNAPHTPVVTPAPFDTLIDPDAIELPLDDPAQDGFASAAHRDYLYDYAGVQRLTRDQIKRARQCYYGHVAFVDHVLGYFLEAAAKMGELDHTIIAYISDHGCHLGDHGFFQKQSFWDAAALVPLFFSGPGIRAAEIRSPINAGSLLPTLMALVGLRVPAGDYPSLAPFLTDAARVAEEPIFSEVDYGLWGYRPSERCVMVRDGRFKLSLYRDPVQHRPLGGPEDRVMFDLVSDPGEQRNLAADAGFRDVIAALVAKIDAWDESRPIAPLGLSAEAEARVQARAAARLLQAPPRQDTKGIAWI